MKIDFAWGLAGLRSLVDAGYDHVVVVDVLRFTTAVDVAVARGAVVFPYPWNDSTAGTYAATRGAELAVPGTRVDEGHPWSLSPTALTHIPPGTRLVLPSPNGAVVACEAADHDGTVAVIAACLRNAPAVADYATAHGERVAVVAAGERWGGHDGPLRPALEDLVGAGAVLHALDPSGRASTADAQAVAAAFLALADGLDGALRECPSGRELCSRGWDDDVRLAARHGVSDCVPIIEGDAFVDGSGVGASMGE